MDFDCYAYKQDLIVAGLISHSGTAFNFKANTANFSQTSFLSAAASLGCEGSEVVSCMSEQPVAALLDASTKAKPLPSVALAQATFHPTVDNLTVFEDYVAPSAAGAFAPIPYLASNTNNENGFYLSAAGQNITLTDRQ